MLRHAIVLCLICASAPALALRCPGGLVSRGDHMYEVIAACGEPVFRDRVVEYPFRVYDVGGLPRVEYLPLAVVTEEWIYDFGRHRFRQALRFRNNRVAHIEVLSKPR